MRSNEERIRQLHENASRLRRERALRRLRAACVSAGALCTALVVSLALSVSYAAPRVSGGILSEHRMASILIPSGASGYVLVAVVAFVLGALLTVFCVRLMRRAEEKEREDDRKL